MLQKKPMDIDGPYHLKSFNPFKSGDEKFTRYKLVTLKHTRIEIILNYKNILYIGGSWSCKVNLQDRYSQCSLAESDGT